MHVWDLATLGTGLDLKSLELGSLDVQSKEPRELEFQYQVLSNAGLLSSGTIMLEYTPTPDDFELGQAYPNPFNPRTTMQYALAADVEMVLAVLDIQGRLVTELSKGFMPAGYYEATWDASQYSSGIYFIRIQAYDITGQNNFESVQKIMLVK